MTPREIQQRCHRLEKLFIAHPAIVAAEAAIEDLMLRLPIADDLTTSVLCTDTDTRHTFVFDNENALQEDEENDLTQYCVLIVGAAGSGKTRLKDRIKARPAFLEDRSGVDGDVVPLVAFDMPDMATPKALIEELCGRLGITLPPKVTRNSLSRMLRDHLRKLGTKLIVIDEAHALCERRNDAGVLAAARALKFLLNTCGVPMVLLGEESLANLQRSKAFKRRVDAHISLQPYSWSDCDDRFEFLDYLDQLDEALGFKKRSEIAVDMDIASRLYFYAGGHIGLVVKILAKGLKIALRGGHKKIDSEILAEAYADFHPAKKVVLQDPDLISESEATIKNPFSASRSEFKRMWADKYAPSQPEDKSAVVKRGRKPKAPQTIFDND